MRTSDPCKCARGYIYLKYVQFDERRMKPFQASVIQTAYNLQLRLFKLNHVAVTELYGNVYNVCSGF